MLNPIHRQLTLIVALWACMASAWAAGPTVSNVRSVQRPGSQLVDIDYDVGDPDSATLTVSVTVSENGGVSYTVPATSFTGAVGVGVTPGRGKRIIWNAGADYPNKFTANVRFRITANDDPVPPTPSGMALIPAGTFEMGDSFNDSTDNWAERPVHSVFVSAFYMDKYEVTKALWDEVKDWGGGNGYDLGGVAEGKAPNHPVQMVDWYDVVKWCNARSQKEGRVPAYYTDLALTQVYKTGRLAPYVKWNAGYRLPTEAEWEKAARGGTSGHRFPWSVGETITHSRANYYSTSSYNYDVSPTREFHPTYAWGGYPYTSPVGSFAPNGYGLYDMAGNVWEWCWDLYGGYSGGIQTDPRGPGSGSFRVFRGGSWIDNAFNCRLAYRGGNRPVVRFVNYGFRSVLPPGQP